MHVTCAIRPYSVPGNSGVESKGSHGEERAGKVTGVVKCVCLGRGSVELGTCVCNSPPQERVQQAMLRAKTISGRRKAGKCFLQVLNLVHGYKALKFIPLLLLS